MSLIWQFFTVKDQVNEVAKCTMCLEGIKRECVVCLPKNFTTTRQHKHVKPLHASAYSQAQDQKMSEKEDLVDTGPNPKQRKLAPMNCQRT